MMKKATVFGAGGFIGSHLVNRLKEQGFFVFGVDIKLPDFMKSMADIFVQADLQSEVVVKTFMQVDEVYQLAADMGGAGYVFTKVNDQIIVENNTRINLNVAKYAERAGKLFFSSSACVYPKHNQAGDMDPITEESSAYPADPDSEYGWEKLYAERIYGIVARLKPVQMRIGRFHNIYGPVGVYKGGREKAPAAMCHKVALAYNGEEIKVWGDGQQTRSFLYIDDCLDAIRLLMDSDYNQPINIGSEDMVSINSLAAIAIDISGKRLTIKNVDGPQGVRARVSDNRKIRTLLEWEPKVGLYEGMRRTYEWVNAMMSRV